jgi:hypothetical protein
MCTCRCILSGCTSTACWQEDNSLCTCSSHTFVQQTLRHQLLQRNEQGIATECILTAVRREVLLIWRHQWQHLQFRLRGLHRCLDTMIPSNGVAKAACRFAGLVQHCKITNMAVLQMCNGPANFNQGAPARLSCQQWQASPQSQSKLCQDLLCHTGRLGRWDAEQCQQDALTLDSCPLCHTQLSAPRLHATAIVSGFSHQPRMPQDVQ